MLLWRLMPTSMAFGFVYVYQQRYVESLPSGATAARHATSTNCGFILQRGTLEATGTVIYSKGLSA